MSRTSKYDWGLVDKMAAEGARERDIIIASGIPRGTVKNHLFLRRGGKTSLVETREAMIMPADRLPLAVAMKIRGWTPQHRAAFLGGPEAARWALEVRVI
ncbi:MAG: hypothetical protein WAZ60_23765 [Desulfosalsimonadaceae bacterium]